MIGRPEKDEAGEFHWGYINQVEGDDPTVVMAGQAARLEELLGGVTEERSHYRYAEGKWSIRESMGHVIDTERIFAYRALWFARGLSDPLPGFDQDVAVAGGKADAVSLAEHLEEFRLVRLTTMAMFRHLPEDAWMRVGVASGKSITVRAAAFVIAGHVEHHLKLFKEKYLS